MSTEKKWEVEPMPIPLITNFHKTEQNLPIISTILMVKFNICSQISITHFPKEKEKAKEEKGEKGEKKKEKGRLYKGTLVWL